MYKHAHACSKNSPQMICIQFVCVECLSVSECLCVSTHAHTHTITQSSAPYHGEQTIRGRDHYNRSFRTSFFLSAPLQSPLASTLFSRLPYKCIMSPYPSRCVRVLACLCMCDECVCVCASCSCMCDECVCVCVLSYSCMCDE